MIEKHQAKSETCPKCFTELLDAPGIGPYCPNKECDVIDDVLNFDKPSIKIDFKFPVSDFDRKIVIEECIAVIDSANHHDKEYFINLLRNHFGAQ